MNKNLLGIDFEDWFHPELVQKYISKENHEPKIINGIEKILELLRKKESNATFFVVGELLEFKPELFDIILENGHEIAFHTMKHDRIDSLNFQNIFETEIRKFHSLTNGKSRGFRAPSFSLNQKSSWLIDVLENNNYTYDSSIVPAKTSLYGMPDAEIKPYTITSNSLEKNSNGKITEFPILVTKFLGKTIPAGGGFYLRTLPMKIITNAIKNYEKKNIPSTFYIHSWELTPEFMPKIKMSKKDDFITYHNLGKAFDKMDSLLDEFEFTSFENFSK
ncbi:xylanase [Candidatus Nitrosopelagicus brevis]|uniref:PF11959 domain protein n=1 Tax=Candidatus Nitrosopelagicus brevis TaxID=1410606 RepID=A0A0A7V0S8_9ARCH|nr:polysaccharide deacetylase family protein [Candidatus Nitrosopelagicus brevis]AJA92629.1 PF11959 domain protein [Candidatus Nitrosopelagicus brevis]MAR69760.1 xylanase [Nitrospina sp.]PTL87422.1 xylanase [Candidatus Nitrosopelagicus brevis]|tara:strand:+ start:581 stop:1408 length:828 start_codon:yes stop_codon:yes gene_type:complete